MTRRSSKQMLALVLPLSPRNPMSCAGSYKGCLAEPKPCK